MMINNLRIIQQAELEDYDFDVLRQFIELFPSTHMAQLLRAYLQYMGIPLREDEDEEPPRHDDADDEFDQIEIMMVHRRLHACPYS